MDKKAMHKLSYGIFLLSTTSEGIGNGCIINTCIQVANDPNRIAISVINKNYTCDLIKRNGYFSIGVLDNTVTFDTIKHFGYQSGRDVNKFQNISCRKDVNGCPYIVWQTCAQFSCKVVESLDLGSHTLFIAEVIDSMVINDNESLTYSYYQSKVKPKPETMKEENGIVGWRCKICGYEYVGENLPEDFLCPICGHDSSDFEPIYKK